MLLTLIKNALKHKGCFANVLCCKKMKFKNWLVLNTLVLILAKLINFKIKISIFNMKISKQFNLH